MDNLLEEKKEALQAAGEYLEKFIPGLHTLCGELKGDRKEDTDDFQKQCIDGLNWIIQIYNRTSDIMDLENISEEAKAHMNKQALNENLIRLGRAIQNKEDEKIAEILENAVIPFMRSLSVVIANLLK